jgi:Secretion system C-terminal sorting domain
MKKNLLLLLFLSSFIDSFSQLKVVKNPTIIQGQLLKTTVPLSRFVPDPNWINEVVRDNTGLIIEHEEFENKLHQAIDPNALPKGVDAAKQNTIFTNYANFKSTSLLQNYNGIGNTGVSPADPSLCTGPNYVIQMINGSSGSLFKIHNKNGTVALAQGYMDAISGVPGAGDPIALYDQLADRYFISEFSATGNKLIVMISQTNSPLGSWYVYSFTCPSFPDYPKYALWNNAYICTTNEGDNGVYAMDRTKMLAGDITATMQRFSIPSSPTISFQASTPVCIEGTTPPPVGTPAMIMRMVDDAWTTAADVDRLEMWNLTLDFTTPANSILAQQADLNTAAFDTDFCGYTTLSCIDQPSTQKMDPLREVLMNKIIYRNFGTHQAIVCSHATDVDATDRAGVRWYELRKVGVAAWNIYQQGTYSPDAADRWMGSICIDASGAIGLAYNVSSSTIFPSIKYTGRKPCDPLGTMTIPETTIIAGGSSHTNERWGDYNSLCIDPADNKTMWFTGMYMPASGGWTTRIAAFDIASCAPEVSFLLNNATVNESAGTTPNNCKPYTDLTATIKIEQAPTQPATITLNKTGTAIEGVDYDLIYTNPIILDAANLTRDITVRLYNDGNVEPNETVILNYTLNANGGNAVLAASNQTFTLNIIDNDFAPTPADTMFRETFDAITTGLGTWTQTGTGVLNNWIVNTNGGTGFQNKAAYISDNTTTNAYNYTITQTTSKQLESPSINTTGKTNLVLKFKYKCNGEFSGTTFYDYGQVLYSANGGAWVVLQNNIQGVATATNQSIVLPVAVENIANLKIAFKFIADNTVGNQPPFGVDSIYIVQSGQSIQTSLNTTTGWDEQQLGPNATVHFYDKTNGNIMATVTNLSAHDYGCTRVEVDRAGTGAIDFINTTADKKFFAKTYKIIPTTNNASGSVKVKLYYTNAEVSGWQTVTAQPTASCYMTKVAGNNTIANVNSGNYNSYVLSSFATTQSAFGTGTAFETSFFNGFSGFGIGLPPITALPVNFVSFQGSFISKNQIELLWKTASENGTKNFEIERSVDGFNFIKIGIVTAANISNVIKSYMLLDNGFARNSKNYYRLKMNDLNGNYRYSEIIMLEDKSVEMVEVFPNPIKDGYLNVRIQENNGYEKLELHIISADGKIVYNKVLLMDRTLQQINISNITNGSYTIKIKNGKENLYQKIVIISK